MSINYKKGVKNGAADALSRKAKFNQCTAEHQAITTTVPKWLEDITTTYEGDEWAKNSMAAVLVDPENQTTLSLLNGVLKYKK